MLAILAATALLAPVKTEIVPIPGGWELRRAGKPYYVRGAGAQKRLDDLVRAGGNSIRTWGADGIRPLLDEAHRLGLTVTVGLWINKKHEGFDPADPKQVEAQVAEARRRAREYKDHPALLMWAVGNEMELGNTSPELFKAVDAMAKAIKEEDPNHPVISVVADMWPEKMDLLLNHCPNLDALGVNSYGGLPTLHERMARWDRPYLVTEYAFPTPQESPQWEWGARQELDSATKAEITARNYREAIRARRPKVLGSYVFYWGNSDNQTASWYNLFLRTGEKLQAVDELTKEWTGRYPRNRAPITQIVRRDIEATVPPNGRVRLTFTARDPEGDRLAYTYEITSDDPSKRFVGDFEKKMPIVRQGRGRNGRFEFRAPTEPGGYRALLIARDGKGGAATASVSFAVHVRSKTGR